MDTPERAHSTRDIHSIDTPPSTSHANGSIDEHVALNRSVSTQLQPTATPQYRVYKRRFLGLAQLILLNIVVSWSWLTYAPVSTTASEFFSVSVSTVNWLSTAFLFAFCVATPVTVCTLNRHGPKSAITTAGVLICVGDWIRYAGTRAGSEGSKFGVVMFGQILMGFGQPFVLTAPTQYSNVWFTEKGRVAATAVASLANPLGGALGQLIDPFWCTKPSDVPNMTLWVAVIATIAAIPSFFLPTAPPTPPTPTSSLTSHPLNLRGFRALARNTSFYVLLPPFVLLVTVFNAISSELNSILYPYGFSEDDAGITGALLILVGLVASAVASPVLDAYTGPGSSARLWVIKAFVIVDAAAYLAFVWAPGTRSDAAPYAIAAIIGASSFILLPLALELLVEVTWEEVGPEVSSSIVWAAAQAGGGITIVVMDALMGNWKAGEPANNMKGGLVFMAVLAWLAVPSPMFLGYSGLGKAKRSMAAEQQRRDVTEDAGV